MSLLFFPGTLIHELSHAFMAVVLQVPVGNMKLFPQIVNNGIKLGSVEIAQTDPLRRLFIGLGPFLFGTILLIATFFYAASNQLFENKLFILIAFYTVFEIGNTMFSSKKDMEGAFELVITIFIILLILYFIGFRLPAFNPELIFSNILIQETFKKSTLYLGVPIIIDLVLILLLKILKA